MKRRIQKSVYLGRDNNGKKVYKYVYGDTEKEANAKANEIRAQLSRGVDLRSDDSLSFWCREFVKNKRIEVGDNQADLYKARLDYFLCYNPVLEVFEFDMNYGSVSIKDVKLYHLQAVINELAKYNPYSHKPTAKRTLAAIRHAIIDVYAFAIRNRITDFNTAEGIVIPKSAPMNDRRALTQEEQRRIVEFDHKAQLPALLMMLGGLRRGEVTALTWADVDFEKNTITINKSYDFKQGRIKQPKTKAGTRTINMPEVLADFLMRQPRKTFLVLDNNGYYTNGMWTRLIKTYLHDLEREYGRNDGNATLTIQPFSWHCLRHTCASILYASGVDVLTAAKYLGHANVSTTMQIYTHLEQETEKISMEKFDNHLRAWQMRGIQAENR